MSTHRVPMLSAPKANVRPAFTGLFAELSAGINGAGADNIGYNTLTIALLTQGLSDTNEPEYNCENPNITLGNSL